MAKLNKIPGTYQIKPQALETTIRKQYRYEIINSHPHGDKTAVLIIPVESIAQGKPPTFSQQTRLMTWITLDDLVQVS